VFNSVYHFMNFDISMDQSIATPQYILNQLMDFHGTLNENSAVRLLCIVGTCTMYDLVITCDNAGGEAVS